MPPEFTKGASLGQLVGIFFFCDEKLEERKIAVENSASARASPGKVLFRQTRTSALNFARKAPEESVVGEEVARGV